MARGEWWEYLIPIHRDGLIAADITDAINGKKDGDKTGIMGTRNEGTGNNWSAPQNETAYAQSNDRVTAAKRNLDTVKGLDPGNYVSEYASQISGAQDQLNKMNEKGFSYDYTKDAAYQQYKNQYTRGAELASEDATARAAARSGGYGNSWGTSSGQTAYQTTMNGLSDVADSLYDQAYNRYATQKSDLSNKIGALQQQESLAQDAHNMKVDAWRNQLNNATNEYNSAVAAAQQKQSNDTQTWGAVASTAASILPWALKALGVLV